MKEFDLEKAKKLYLKAKKAYYEEEREIMSDAAFDKLEDQIREADPKWEELAKTGVRTKHKAEVELAEFMPSLHKVYPEHEKKIARHAYSHVTNKLDGTSLQLVYKGGQPVALHTRGNGRLGKDVSHFIPFLIEHGAIPTDLSDRRKVVLRLEAVMEERLFQKKWSTKAKGKDGFDNSRQCVNGLFNRQKPGKAMADVSMVVLGVYGYTIEEGLDWAADNAFDVVTLHKPPRKGWTPATLSELLKKAIAESKFNMDGMVLVQPKFVLRYADEDKPVYTDIVAFKENDETNAPEVVVKSIIWQKTRFNRWAPKVEIEPTEMDGVVVTYATCHNAAWMVDRGIGPGAIIRCLRSGGVIPKIVGVVKKAKKLSWPEGITLDTARWDGVHLMAEEVDEETVIEQIQFAFTTMGVEHIARGSIKKLLPEYDSFLSYIKLAQHDYAPPVMRKLLGSEKNAAKIHAELRDKLQKPELKKLMVASGCFEAGIGMRKLSALQDNIKLLEFTTLSRESIVTRLSKVKGFGPSTINKLADGVVEFGSFLKEVLKHTSVHENIKRKVRGGKLEGITVAFTGYRDKEQEALIERNGGEVTSFSNKTKVLLYKESGKASSKVEKAGPRAMQWEQFVKRYGI